MGKYSVSNTGNTGGGSGGVVTVTQTVYKTIPSRDRGFILPSGNLLDVQPGDYWTLGELGTYPFFIDSNGSPIIGKKFDLVTYKSSEDGSLTFFQHTERDLPFGHIDSTEANKTLSAADIKEYVTQRILESQHATRNRGPIGINQQPTDLQDGDYFTPISSGVYPYLNDLEVGANETGHRSRATYSLTYPGNWYLTSIPENNDLLVAFPFKQGPTVASYPGLENFFSKFDVRFPNIQAFKRLSIKRIWNVDGGNRGVQLIDTENPSVVIAQFYSPNFGIDASGVDDLTLSAFGGSGITAYVRVHWDQLAHGTYSNINIEIDPENYSYQDLIDGEAISHPFSDKNSYVSSSFKSIKDSYISFRNKSDFYIPGQALKRSFYASQIKRNVSNYWIVIIKDDHDDAIVAQFATTEPRSGSEKLVIDEYQGSGVFIDLMINWDEVPEGITQNGAFYLKEDYYVLPDLNTDYPRSFSPLVEELEQNGSSPMPIGFVPHYTKAAYPELTMRKILSAITIYIDGFIGLPPSVTISKIARNHDAYGHMIELMVFEDNAWKRMLYAENIDITESIYASEAYKTIVLPAKEMETPNYWELLIMRLTVNWRSIPENQVFDLTQNKTLDGVEIYHRINPDNLIQAPLDEITKTNYYVYS